VADDNGLVHFVFLNIGSDIVADGLKKRRFDARLSSESSQGENVALVSVFVVRDRGIPSLAGGGEAGNEDHGLSFSNDVDVEGWRGRLRECRDGGQQKEKVFGHEPTVRPYTPEAAKNGLNGGTR